MKIPENPSDFQKRAKGQLSGKRGESFLEVTEYPQPPKELQDLLTKNKSSKRKKFAHRKKRVVKTQPKQKD